jgi:RimJ/RimL family protein N-acetyltransferase
MSYQQKLAADEELSSERRLPGGFVRASEEFWGVDWETALPRLLTSDGIELRCSDIERALPFIGNHYATIFEEQPGASRFLAEPFDGAKLRYYRRADVFEVADGNETVGLVIGEPSDWSSYYLRTMGLLPEYHGRQLASSILTYMFDVLGRVGVRRFELDTSPSNMATIQVLTRLRFNITGQFTSERWGALLRFTKFLDDRAEEVFLDSFCTGIRYQRRHRPVRLKEGGASEEEVRASLSLIEDT